MTRQPISLINSYSDVSALKSSGIQSVKFGIIGRPRPITKSHSSPADQLPVVRFTDQMCQQDADFAAGNWQTCAAVASEATYKAAPQFLQNFQNRRSANAWRFPSNVNTLQTKLSIWSNGFLHQEAREGNDIWSRFGSSESGSGLQPYATSTSSESEEPQNVQFEFGASSGTSFSQPLSTTGNVYPQGTTDLASELSGLVIRAEADRAGDDTSKDESDDSDEEHLELTHPNKFPVEIEYHNNKSCCYWRQPTRSGPKVKQIAINTYNPQTLQPDVDLQLLKYYQKDLVRICRCGQYEQMDGALAQGRPNDCNGYEIHHSQKCKWKAYDDFKTGKRVLICLCKCYKPT